MRKILIPVLTAAIVLAGCQALWDGHVSHVFPGVFPVFDSSGQWIGSCWMLERHHDQAIFATAGHVASLSPGRVVLIGPYMGSVAYTHPTADVALLLAKVPLTDHPRDFDLAFPKAGEKCWAVGLQRNSNRSLVPVVYVGHVVASDYLGCTIANTGAYYGMSGGPLLNQDSKVIGLTSKPYYDMHGIYDSSIIFSSPVHIREARDSLFRELENPHP